MARKCSPNCWTVSSRKLPVLYNSAGELDSAPGTAEPSGVGPIPMSSRNLSKRPAADPKPPNKVSPAGPASKKTPISLKVIIELIKTTLFTSRSEIRRVLYFEAKSKKQEQSKAQHQEKSMRLDQRVQGKTETRCKDPFPRIPNWFGRNHQHEVIAQGDKEYVPSFQHEHRAAQRGGPQVSLNDESLLNFAINWKVDFSAETRTLSWFARPK